DFIAGTEGMLRYVADFKEPTDFLVATEANMLWQLQNKVPLHRYHPVPGITCACNKCPHMARNTLENLRDCLMNDSPEITWQPEFERAREVLQRSLLNCPARPRGAILLLGVHDASDSASLSAAHRVSLPLRQGDSARRRRPPIGPAGGLPD